MNGLILVNKNQGCTSHDIIVEIRKILNTQKIGHFGTLDPLATGLMVIAVEKATRLFPFFSKTDKLYEGQIKLGFSTDTYDSFGKPISPEIIDWPEKNKILKTINKLKRETTQIPPPFSAKKYKGKPLYKLVRNKKEFELKPSKIFIYFFNLKKYHAPFLDFEIKCSSGTYIRSLAHDLGQILGCGAHLSRLNRTEVGTFRLFEAFSLEEIKKLVDKRKIENFLIPLESLLPQFPKIILKETESVSVKNGNMIFPENILRVIPQDSLQTPVSKEKEAIFRLFSQEGKLLALAKKKPEQNSFHPFLVFC